MTDAFDPSTLTDRRDQAAWWHARLQSDDVTAEEHAAFASWRSDPQNAHVYRQVQQVWAIADALPLSEVRKLADDHKPTQAAAHPLSGPEPQSAKVPSPGISATQQKKAATPRRRALGFGMGFACSVIILCIVADPMGWREVPGYEAQFTTARGEQRHVVLPDGSTLMLNTATNAKAHFYADRRAIDLAQGEILFQVDGTQGTPFIVDTAGGSVRVTGTRFNVRSHSGLFSVGVLEGSVEVTTGPWWNRKTSRLRPSHQLSVSSSGDLLAQESGAENLAVWLEGKVVFRNVALSDALNEINRYATQPVAVADAQAGRLRLSGVFSTNDPAAFLAALPKIVPVAVRPSNQGTAEIAALQRR